MSAARRIRVTGGFSLVEVMVSATVMVVGLLAVTATTATSTQLRRRTVEQQAVFDGLVARLEWARSVLFTDSAFDAAARGALKGGAAQYEQSFLLDRDADGFQDVSFAPGDALTPVVRVRVLAAEPADDPDVLVEVRATATWFGAGGNRTLTLSTMVANRSGYAGP